MVFLPRGNLRGEENMSRFNKIDMDKHTKTRMVKGERCCVTLLQTTVIQEEEGQVKIKGCRGRAAFICSTDVYFMKIEYLSAKLIKHTHNYDWYMEVANTFIFLRVRVHDRSRLIHLLSSKYDKSRPKYECVRGFE